MAITTFIAGCNSSKRAPAVIPYNNIQLGMSFDDAKTHIGGDGEVRDYDKLPVIPKPRDIYAKLPPDTEWRVWSDNGNPKLILGVVGGKVAYKQVMWTENGERKSDTNAMPAYQ